MNTPDYKSLNSSSARESQIKKHYPEFHSYLLENYPDDLLFSERLYWYYNNITDYPTCKTCGGRVQFLNSKKGYRDFCCNRCMSTNNEIVERRQQTCIERYGTKSAMSSDIVKQRLKESNIKKYGVENAFQRQDVKDKIKSKNLEKLGVEYPMQSSEVRSKSTKTIREKYGVEWNCQRPEARNYCNDSKSNKQFEALLRANNIVYEREFSLDHYRYDFKIGNTLIEINPSSTHNSTWGIRGHDALPSDYHLKKSLAAYSHNFHCIHIWDWDDQDKILNLLKTKISLGARQCEIREVSVADCNNFLNAFHIQSSCKNQTVRIGLYYNDELVELMTFGKPRYNKNYEWELLRLCSSSGYNVIGGAQRLFKYFIKHYSPKSVISYCDRSKFNGDVYKKMGFECIRNSKTTKHWWNGKQHITDNLLRQRGFDQLFNTDYGKGTSNEELMKQYKFVEIWDCGQDTYTYIPN